MPTHADKTVLARGLSFLCRSDRRLPTRLIRKSESEEAAADNQGARDVYRNGSLEVRVQRNDGSLHVARLLSQRRSHTQSEATTHDNSKDTRRRCRQSIPSATVLGREHLRRDGVQHTVHDLPAHQPLTPPSMPTVKIRTLLKNAYPQFQPRSASELLAVVDAKRKTPVSPGFRAGVVE